MTPRREKSPDKSNAITVAIIAAVGSIIVAAIAALSPALVTRLFPPKKTETPILESAPAAPNPQLPQLSSQPHPNEPTTRYPSVHNKKEAESQQKLATEYAKAGEKDKAIEALRKASVLDPTNATLHKCLGRAYVATRLDLDAAIKQYQLAAKTDGTDESEKGVRLALVHKDALERAAQRVVETPNDAEAHRNLARVLEPLQILGAGVDSECRKAELLEKDDAKRINFKLNCMAMVAVPEDDNNCPF